MNINVCFWHPRSMMDAVLATIFDGGRAICRKHEKLSNYINFTLNLSNRKKPRDSALGQPLRMAVHVSDWGNSLNQCCREGKRLTMVMMFVGEGVVSVLDRIIALFLQWKTYGVGVFCVPAQTLIGVILLKYLTSCSRLLTSYTHQ